MDVEAPLLPDFARYRVEPGEEIALDDLDPADTGNLAGEEEVEGEYSGLREQIADLQERLYAEERRSLLIVLQGIDAAGKDGTVKHVLRGTNPAGVRVHSFKEPSNEERAHDFLWRYHQATPADGMIGVFNRSHYEDVLVVRVKELAPEELWRSRYDSINDFERMLVREGTTIVKFFLHISKAEQLEKFRERLDRPDKYWKWSDNDIRSASAGTTTSRPTRMPSTRRARPGRRGTWSPPTTAGSATTSSRAWSPARSRRWTRSSRRRRRTSSASRRRSWSGPGERPLEAEGERLAGQVVGDVEREPRAEVVDQLGGLAQRGQAAPSASSRELVAAVGVVRELGRAGGDAGEVAVPEAGELEAVVERGRLGAALGAAGLLAELGLAPLVLLAREELQLVGEPRLVRGAGGGAARARRSRAAPAHGRSAPTRPCSGARAKRLGVGAQRGAVAERERERALPVAEAEAARRPRPAAGAAPCALARRCGERGRRRRRRSARAGSARRSSACTWVRRSVSSSRTT